MVNLTFTSLSQVLVSEKLMSIEIFFKINSLYACSFSVKDILNTSIRNTHILFFTRSQLIKHAYIKSGTIVLFNTSQLATASEKSRSSY